MIAEDRFRQADLPRRHRGALHRVLERVRAEPDSQYAKTYEAARLDVQAGRSVVLIGRRGTGKTQMSTAIAYEWCHRLGRSALYRRFADLCADFKSLVYHGGMGEHDWMRRHRSIGLLVIDEMQEAYGSETEGQILTRLFDHRYGAMVPTLMIANMTREAIAVKFGPSMVSRLQETGVVYECDWPSYRGQEKP